MTRPRAACLTAILVVALALVGPGFAAAATCGQAQTPPAPPARGAVLWSPPQESTVPNVLVLNFGDRFSDVQNCSAPAQNPWVISVAPGGALAFYGGDRTTGAPDALVSPWGAVNVPPGGTGAVQINPQTSGRWQNWSGVTSVAVVDPGVLLGSYSSCRQCVLSSGSVTLPGNLNTSDGPIVGFVGDVTGSKLLNVTFTGDGTGYDFSGADLSGSSFAGASLPFATFNRVTANSTGFGADLRGATFTSLTFQAPPSFTGATLGGESATCTSFVNTNLLDARFVEATWASGCTGPLFPGSQVSVTTLWFLLVIAQAQGVNLSNAQVVASGFDFDLLAGATLSGMNLAGLQFLGVPVDLTGAHFDGATLTGTSFMLARLTGATFANVSAAGASFLGANLSRDTTHPGANFSGPNTNLQGANFVNADVSGASFVGANLTDAQFTGARGVDTDFSGVTAPNAVFALAHLYGNGNAFNTATNLQNIDFTGAVLAADANESGGFDFSGADLTGARFDEAVCVACNFQSATLNQASFTKAYLPGIVLSSATLPGVSFDRSWLYCGSLQNDWCTQNPITLLWSWPLALGSGESFGPVPFATTDLTGVSLAGVTACPDDTPASSSGGCQGHLLPNASEAPVFPAPCSASAHGACPTRTSTLWQPTARPLAVVPTAPPTWSTALSGQGYYVGLDDGSIWLVGNGPATLVAGTPGTKCPGPSSTCGDGGPAAAALLSSPSGLAVGLDGSLYIADPGLLRVRVIDPSGTINTLVGQLTAANAVAVYPGGIVTIADGPAGVRELNFGGLSTLLNGIGNVVSVAHSGTGLVYLATRSPDLILQFDPIAGGVQTVVGTGTSGYNGNTDPVLGTLLLGTKVQINQPGALAMNLDGNLVFADTGNNLIRAYVPSTGHVINDIAGSIVQGTPQGGFNGDGNWASDTQLNGPLGVTPTQGALLVIADTGNQRVRQVGPGPAGAGQVVRGPEVVISCQLTRIWSCQRLPKTAGTVAAAKASAVTISHAGTVVATGRLLPPGGGRVRFLVVEQRPLVPGSYGVVIQQAGRREQAISIAQGTGLTSPVRR